MRDTLGFHHTKGLPSKNEIRLYCKNRMIEEELAEDLVFITNKILSDCCVWLEGYCVGVQANTFQEPIHKDSLSDFYLDKAYLYVLNRLDA